MTKVGDKLTEVAKFILRERYLLKDNDGKIIESFEQMFLRVATHVASADKKYNGENVDKTIEEFYEMMARLDFTPSSPILFNAGLNMGLFACYVLEVEDSMEHIFETLKTAGLIMQGGGGVGVSFSLLRPKDDIVNTTKGKSSGVVSFMKLFNVAGDIIKQGGRRRAALLAGLNIHHPEILNFVECKNKEGEFENFNISVVITDEFMSALENNEEYELYNPRTNLPAGKLLASKVWDKIISNSWALGEPGVLFVDTINKSNPTPNLGNINCTNPCVTGDTMILIPDTDSTTYSTKEVRADSLKLGDNVIVQGGTGQEFSPIEKIEAYLKKEVFLVETDIGRDIKVTRSHQFLATKKEFWVQKYPMTTDFYPLHELKKGDFISLTYKKWGYPEKYPQKKAKIKNIKKIGVEPVYDYYCGWHDTWITNGYISKGCGEEPLLDKESCLLGSINLLNFVTEHTVKWQELEKCIYTAIHFLDNVVDINIYPTKEIEEATKATRKLGLGVLGYHDVLIKRKIKYDSEKAISFAEKIARFINEKAFEASCQLAKERGTFPAIKGSIYDKPYGDKPRNATRTCVAPTGTTHQICGVSSGLEPNFAYEYDRLICGKKIKVRHWALDDPSIDKKYLQIAENIKFAKPTFH